MDTIIAAFALSVILYAALSPRWRTGRAIELWHQGYTWATAWRKSTPSGLVSPPPGPQSDEAADRGELIVALVAANERIDRQSRALRAVLANLPPHFRTLRATVEEALK